MLPSSGLQWLANAAPDQQNNLPAAGNAPDPGDGDPPDPGWDELALRSREQEFVVFAAMQGQLQIEFAGQTEIVTAGGMASLPSGTEHATLVLEDRTSWISAHSDPAADLLFELAGTPTERFMNPADAPAMPNQAALNELSGAIDITFV